MNFLKMTLSKILHKTRKTKTLRKNSEIKTCCSDYIVHCIGDSHACFFRGQDKIVFSLEENDSLIPFFKIYHIGPVLAYNLCESNASTQGREKIFELLDNRIPPGSKLLLCFGEIDCRNHILRQSERQKRFFEDVTEECVSRYFQFIKEVNAKGYEVLVWGVVPNAPDDAPEYPNFPTCGSCFERNRVTRCFNQKLKELLDAENIKFISIFDKLIDSQGLTIKEFYMDFTHLSQNAMGFALEEIRKCHEHK